MSFVLTSGSFAAIEKTFCDSFQHALKLRKDPLRDEHLVLVPTSAVRKHLLRLLFESGCNSFSAARIVSLNGLAQEILLDTLGQPYSALDDPIYFVLALESVARKLGLRQFQSYRTARGLLSSIRDLVDGMLTPDLMEEFLEQTRTDPDLQRQVGNTKTLRELHAVYGGLLESLNAQKIVNAQYSSAIAAENMTVWFKTKNIRALHVYGFYDATPAQMEWMELLAREIHLQDGDVRWYFPFAVIKNAVEHPAEYAQGFFDSLYALHAKLGGTYLESPGTDSGASNGLESGFFLEANQEKKERPGTVQIFSAGSPYEEAWLVAKKILQLVVDGKARFDQIGVMARSMESCRQAFQHVFADNRIPHSMPRETTLCSSTSGHFIYLLLLVRQSNLNHNLVFELLCSPLLLRPFSPAGIIRELLEMLFITNGDDWHRLKQIADPQKKLPDIFELFEEDSRVEHFHKAAAYLIQLKEQLDHIPKQARVSDYANILQSVIHELAEPNRFQEAGGFELELLLERLKELPLETIFDLNEFVEIFKDYLQNTRSGVEPETTDGVTIGDIMSLRGVSFDHVFVVGLNQDVWPLRTSEDPFLPDGLRATIRSTTGLGPHPKKRHPKNDEELLLLSLALRTAKQNIHLSYQRADSDGRTKSASIYIEEAIRLLQVPIEVFPRHLEKRLTADFLPSPQECSTLVHRYSPYEATQQFHSLPAEYVDRALDFAARLNSVDPAIASSIDGILDHSGDFWKTFSEGKLRYSFSRIRDYVRCGFLFFSDRVLKLRQSPFKPTEIPHDLTPMVRGRIAESVVKDAILKLKTGSCTIESAVSVAEAKIRRKYAPYLPKVLVDHYLLQFSEAARTFLDYLQTEGYDFSLAEVPDRNYMPEMQLVENDAGVLNIYGIPDLLIYGQKRLIGEMKWGASATKETVDFMFKKGELQFCFYPELERHHRQLLETADFRYFRLNIFAELGSPADLEQKLIAFGSPGKIETTLRIFGNAPSQEEIAIHFEKIKDLGKEILNGQFRIVEDPNDIWGPCTSCGFLLICRRTHSATLLRSKSESEKEIVE